MILFHFQRRASESNQLAALQLRMLSRHVYAKGVVFDCCCIMTSIDLDWTKLCLIFISTWPYHSWVLSVWWMYMYIVRRPDGRRRFIGRSVHIHLYSYSLLETTAICTGVIKHLSHLLALVILHCDQYYYTMLYFNHSFIYHAQFIHSFIHFTVTLILYITWNNNNNNKSILLIITMHHEITKQ